jgi:hypothetical protein
MHAGEVEIDVSLVARLLAAQFPHGAGLPIKVGEPAMDLKPAWTLFDRWARDRPGPR